MKIQKVTIIHDRGKNTIFEITHKNFFGKQITRKAYRDGVFCYWLDTGIIIHILSDSLCVILDNGLKEFIV